MLPPEATVLAALDLMRDRRMRSVLVAEGTRLVGIVTQGDCAMKVLRPGLIATQTLLRDIMTRDPQCISPDAPLEKCMDLMMNRRIRHLPVSDKGQVIGMLSIGDIVREMLGRQSRQIDQLERKLRGPPPVDG
jgi:CBS domain-containing protein